MEPTRAHGDTHALIPPAPTRSRSTSPAPWPISVDHWRPLGAQQLQATRPAAAPAPYAAPRPAVPRAPLHAAELGSAQIHKCQVMFFFRLNPPRYGFFFVVETPRIVVETPRILAGKSPA